MLLGNLHYCDTYDQLDICSFSMTLYFDLTIEDPNHPYHFRKMFSRPLTPTVKNPMSVHFM